MAVQVWIGEKPEHPNERRAIVALANGLERLDGLYLILANFSVGGRTIDLVVIKQDAIFILELKHCDGRVFGDVNGPWFVESDNGVRKRLNSNRKNPYNQVISYYYSLTNFLKDHRSEFLSPNRASAIDFRSCRRVIVVAPTLQTGSQVDIDWKVDLRGLDELPVYLVTERSPDIELTEDEMLAIPQLLHCTRWNEINALIAGVMPAWQQTPSEVAPTAPAPEPEPAPESVAAAPPITAPVPRLWERGQRALRTWPGRLAVSFALLSLILALLLLLRPATVVSRVPDQAATTLVSTSESGLTAGGLGAGGLPGSGSCVWSGYQSTGRRLGEGGWENVGVIGAPPAFQPQVVVTLEEVSFCEGQIQLTWSVRNRGESGDVVLPLTSANVVVRDEDNTDYLVSDAADQPTIRAAPGQQVRGTLLIEQPVSLNAATLRVTLKKQPFGEAVWLVPVPGQF